MSNTSSPRIADLSPAEKRTLLAELLREKAGQSVSSHPLSYNQQGIWFLYQLAPESSVYTVNFAARISTEIDVPALRRAFQTLVDRHPALRTTFPVHSGKPVQRVHEAQKVHFQEVEGSTWSAEELEARMLEEAYCPFDLERGPLLRVTLFTRSAREHILLLVVHHIVIDFWSLAILLDELGVLYPAEKAGAQVVLPPLKLRYTDYVDWQAEMLASPEGERLWAYWQEQLAGQLPLLQLRTDRPRPAMPTYRGASHDFTMGAELSSGLKALAKAHGATLYMVLLAAFQVVLSYHTDQEDLLVGSPMVGRSRAEFEGIVGLFTNPVVLRANLSGNPTFLAFLDQVRHTVLSALEHQDYPTVLLVERLRPPRDLSRPPLCQVMFVLDKPHRIAQEGAPAFVAAETGLRMNPGGLVLESVPLERRAATLDLVLLIFETQESLAASMRHNTDLFDIATIARMSQHFEVLLRRILEEPTATLDALKRTLAEADRQQQVSVRKEQKEANLQKLKHLKRKTITTSQLSSEVVPRKQNYTNAN
jgi:Condensation domain